MTETLHKPLVSVLMRFYNDEKYIRLSLESILNQNYMNIELVLVNNDSKDNSQNIINEYSKDKRIKILHNKQNIIGGAYNFRKAYSHAQGKYVVFFCADDIMNPECIANKVTALENNPECLACFSHLDIIDSKGNRTKKNFLSAFEDNRFKYLRNLFDNYHCNAFPGAMVRKNDFLLDAMDQRLLFFFDIKMWVNILLRGEIIVLDEFHVKYRSHDGNAGGLKGNKDKYTTYLFELNLFYDEFFKIYDFSTLLNIFPESEDFLVNIDKKNDSDLIPFLVAICLYNNEKFTPYHFGVSQNIALIKMMNLLSNVEIYQKVTLKLIDANQLVALYKNFNEGLEMDSKFSNKSFFGKIRLHFLRKKAKKMLKNKHKITVS